VLEIVFFFLERLKLATIQLCLNVGTAISPFGLASFKNLQISGRLMRYSDRYSLFDSNMFVSLFSLHLL
jgi:hypothetical protein